MTLSSSASVRFSPGSPGPNWRGARLVLDLKRVLPQPPLPPWATLSSWPADGQIAERLLGFGIAHHACRPARDIQILAAAAGAAIARAAVAGLRLEDALDAKVRQRIDAFGPRAARRCRHGRHRRHRGRRRARISRAGNWHCRARRCRPAPERGFIDEFHERFVALRRLQTRTGRPGNRRPCASAFRHGLLGAAAVRSRTCAARRPCAKLDLAAYQGITACDPCRRRRSRRRAPWCRAGGPGYCRPARARRRSASRPGACVGIAAVAGTAACFLVCHESCSDTPYRRADVGDAHLSVMLAVRLLPQIVLAAAKFDDRDLVTLAVLLDRGRHLAALEQRLAQAHVIAIGDQQHLVELDGRAGLGRLASRCAAQRPSRPDTVCRLWR